MGIIDLTGLVKSAKSEPEREREKVYCKHCPGSVEMSYCKEDSNDSSPGMPYRAGDWQCLRCGNVRATHQKTKEQKGPRIRKAGGNSPPFIAMFSTHPDAFDGYFDKKQADMFPEIEDEDSVYESMGATISQIDTFYPTEGRTITRRQKET
jgi:hypothetical protein